MVWVADGVGPACDRVTISTTFYHAVTRHEAAFFCKEVVEGAASTQLFSVRAPPQGDDALGPPQWQRGLLRHPDGACSPQHEHQHLRPPGPDNPPRDTPNQEEVIGGETASQQSLNRPPASRSCERTHTSS